MTYFLKYDEWFDKYHDAIYLELAENGADREMDFNPEEEFRIRYEAYLNTKEEEQLCEHEPLHSATATLDYCPKCGLYQPSK